MGGPITTNTIKFLSAETASFKHLVPLTTTMKKYSCF